MNCKKCLELSRQETKASKYTRGLPNTVQGEAAVFCVSMNCKKCLELSRQDRAFYLNLGIGVGP
jgi:hypothetical protein